MPHKKGMKDYKGSKKEYDAMTRKEMKKGMDYKKGYKNKKDK